MSLPNDDDQDGRQPWRDPFGHRDEAAINPTKKVSTASNDIDDRTTDETSVGSMSFSSDMTSVVAPGGTAIPATPIRQAPARETNIDTPISALTATTPVESDDASIHSGVSCNNAEDETAIQLRRQRNRMQLQVLGASTGATFALFVYMLIPTALLLSMVLFGGVSSAFLYQLANVMQWEFHRSILEGRGIGDYLPENIYQLLTSSSIHDILSDPNGILAPSEHLYLMLYLIPGLTPEQINQYIDRLDPSHQRLLRSDQGLLGFLMNRNNTSGDSNQNSTFMRFIMGDQRLRDWRQHQIPSQHSSNMTPRQLVLPPTIPEEEAPTRTEDDNLSGPADIPSTVAAVVGTEAEPNPPPQATSAVDNSVPADQRPSAISDSVLFDAVTDAVANFVSDTTNSVRERVNETFEETLAGPIYRVSLGVAVLGLGVGTLGLANGTYDVQSLVRPIGQFVTSLFGGGGGSGGSSPSSGPWVRLSLTMPSGSVLVGSTIASGTTAVVLGLFGTTRSRSMGDNGETPPPQAPTATATNGSEPSKC